ncbi:transposase [Streptomyces sp. NPDC050264]|uniref:transposase n=1 Tax=Streptomyces sp. NPDC050264 TaxID=3155038 RepID=UPI0034253EC2
MPMVERLVPDRLWELFQRVVPAAPVRPKGGGRRRFGDRQVLAAVVFVATRGCLWGNCCSSGGCSPASACCRNWWGFWRPLPPRLTQAFGALGIDQLP